MATQHSLEDEKDFVEEDERSNIIKSMTDDEEIDAAIELFEEKYGAVEPTSADKSNSHSDESGASETSTEKNEDTSDEPTGKIHTEPEESDHSKKESVTTSEFTLTEEIINKQPENVRELLSKYKRKGKTELAKASANAISQNNPYLKDNEQAIEAIANKLQSYSDEEIVKTLIDIHKPNVKPIVTQEEQSRSEASGNVEFPPLLDDDANIKSILNQETIKRLKRIYPDMPDDMTSVEYREWERDLLDDGLTKANKFIHDLEAAKSDVTNELQKVVYAQNNLQNLYNESPSEILPYLTEENLPKLKRLNDDYKEINNNALEEEVGLIKKELQKYGITETDLGIDLTLQKDEKGSLLNDELLNLMYNGNQPDSNIIGRFGKVPYLRKGQLAKKFIYENNAKILTHLVNNRTKKDKEEIERLKDTSLNTLATTKSKPKQVITGDNIRNITDDTKLDKIMSEIEAKYS